MGRIPGATSSQTAQIYLITPRLGAADADRFVPLLTEALAAADIACVLLRPAEDAGDDAARRAAEALRPAAQDRDVAFLIEDRADIALATGADGVHLSDPKAYAEARRLLGAQRIVGVTCCSRHDAMTMGESGADYVAFGDLDDAREAGDLVEWWSALMIVPCVAAADGSLATCRDRVAAGADFLAVGDAVWRHPDGPAAALAEIARAIAEAPRP